MTDCMSPEIRTLTEMSSSGHDAATMRVIGDAGIIDEVADSLLFLAIPTDAKSPNRTKDLAIEQPAAAKLNDKTPSMELIRRCSYAGTPNATTLLKPYYGPGSDAIVGQFLPSNLPPMVATYAPVFSRPLGADSMKRRASCFATFNSPSVTSSPSMSLCQEDSSDDHGSHTNYPTKAKRKRLNGHQIFILNWIFSKTVFPSTELRRVLGRSLGLSSRTIQIWFQNKRQSQRVKSRELSGGGGGGNGGSNIPSYFLLKNYACDIHPSYRKQQDARQLLQLDRGDNCKIMDPVELTLLKQLGSLARPV